jgi:cytochrome c-type biogenesis protein CcmH
MPGIVRSASQKFQPGTLWIGMILALMVAAWLMTASAVIADTPEPQGPTDDEINELARQLYCPVCENIPLDVCPTQACAQWRDLIRQKLAAGWSEQQIEDYFVAQYGDRVLSEPPRRGLNWLVYILPPIFFLIGVLILIRVIRRMRRAPQAAEAVESPPGVDDPYLARMEEELQRRKNM